MPRRPEAVSYTAVLRRDGVLRAFAAAIIGRLSYAMISLALLLTIQDATGSYAAAGSALGGYALASFLMPLKSRLIDRLGAASVLPWLSAGLALSLTAAAGLATAGHTAPGLYVALAVGAGLCAPPLGPSMRAIWAAATPEPEARRRAYSLDGVVEEVLFAVGPLAVGVIVQLISSPAALVATAVLNLSGTLALVTSPLSRRHGRPHLAEAAATRWTGPLSQRGFIVMLVVLLGVGLGGGPLEVAVLARAEAADRSAAVGYLLASLSVGSAVGGLLWGRLIHRHRPRRHFLALVAVSAVLSVALVPTTNLVAVAVLLFVVGLAGSPLMVTAYLTADMLVPVEQQREASTWVNTTVNLGVAFGAATAGLLVDHDGAAVAFAAGAAVYAVTLLVIAGVGGRLRGGAA
ncbi:MFS transporter [uncultured Friedmanniella sp.]|uniref:MFS transporter n=1 Tax=uncultured Friedmanniella sp. TaxID=335381 RepID=UPI0035C9B59B